MLGLRNYSQVRQRYQPQQVQKCKTALNTASRAFWRISLASHCTTTALNFRTL